MYPEPKPESNKPDDCYLDGWKSSENPLEGRWNLGPSDLRDEPSDQ